HLLHFLSHVTPLNLEYVFRFGLLLCIFWSCPCRLRINPPGSPVDHHRSKKAWTRELAWLPSGPLSPGDALKVSRLDAPRRRRPLPWLLPTTRLAAPPHR